MVIKPMLIMYSSEDFEKLWFLYKLEGQSKNVSIESFCMQQGVSYRSFYQWFCCRKQSIVPVEIVGMPCAEVSVESVVPKSSLASDVPFSSLLPIASVVISLFNGVQISKSELSYPDLIHLVEKLEVLC